MLYRPAREGTAALLFLLLSFGASGDSDGQILAVPDLVTADTVIGKDDRKKVREQRGNTRAIGIVYANFKNGDETKTYKCTGSLISEEHVLTAAHCVYKAEYGGYATDVSFIPSILDSSRSRDDRYFIGRIWITERFVEASREPVFPNRESDRSDLAVLTIDSHMSGSLADRYGFQGYGYKRDSEERRVDSHTANFYSYPDDKDDRHGLWLEEGCNAFYIDDGSYASDCDTYPGASGGPLLLLDGTGQDHLIYGINSGQSTDINVFTRISETYFREIRNIVTGNDHAVEAFTSTPVDSHPYFGINLRNDCHSTIYVALHYLDIKEGEFVTRGYFEVPGNRVANNVARGTDRYMGLYAQTYNAELVWNGNDFSKMVNGIERSFYIEKLPATWTDRTFSFSCS